jgi:hypothetical protein
MSGYKKNALFNRDALFGNATSSSSDSANNNNNKSKKQQSVISSSTTPTTTSTNNTSRGYQGSTPTTASTSKYSRGPTMSTEARVAKRKEAEEYRDKANQCMKSGLFKSADPVAACTFFKRAADCYQILVGQQEPDAIKLERLYRLESASCNMICKAWASAAADYTRAAELLVLELDDTNTDDEHVMQIRRDAAAFHKKAAEAWTEGNEPGKAAACKVNAALVIHGDDGTNSYSGPQRLSKEALSSIEEAIEAHVPDPLNPYSRYRQTGISAYIDPDSDETAETVSAETMDIAKAHLVTRAYSHESIQKLIHLLARYGEYASALYAAGAVSTVLKAEGMATISLSRAYVTETILTLAMGDPVMAEQQFLNRHCQDTFYLKSRECQLGEELYRAVKTRDIDALNDARNIQGHNKTALANLSHDVLRNVVQDLRISGVARQSTQQYDEAGHDQSTSSKPTKMEIPLADLLSKKTGYETSATGLDPDALAAELDELNFDGLDDDDDDDIGDVGDANDEMDALEDDDIDLR